jgi:hypothetical protein
MGRRTSGATVGIEKIGLVQADANTLTTSQPNQNLLLDPNGTGITQVQRAMMVMGNGSTGGELRLGDADGTHYTVLRTAASTTTNRTLTFPDSAGSLNNVLATDGSGNLSWVAQTTAGVTVADAGASGTTHYLYFGTTTSGQVTSFNYRSNVSFVPSTGELTATALNAANMYGSAASSGTLTLRGTSSGTKATASILMTDNVAASSTSTGTLVVTGGVGVSGTLHAGNLTTGGTLSAATISETSSITLKENLVPIEGALDKIINLTGYIYDRIDGSVKNEAGLIAEYVDTVIPNIVTKDLEGHATGINYTRLTAYLIEAIKTLKEDIEILKGKN